MAVLRKGTQMQTFTIGKLAREAGVGVETVRFYEREGLLEQAARRQSGYRQFTTEDIGRLRFIKQAQWLGFTLKEIRELLALKLDAAATRSDVRRRAVEKVTEINQRIKELQRMKRALTPLIRACDGRGALEGCPILDAIDGSRHVHSSKPTRSR
jgi:Hg(II)-responsive transcriptional regulator